VFVVWLADGKRPSAQALKERDGEEEERRLFYVACTRAKDELTLAFPIAAAPRDRERVVMKASRFIEELPGEPALYERWQLDDDAGPPVLLAAEPTPRLPAPAPAAALLVPALFGVEVESAAHDRSGRGRSEPGVSGAEPPMSNDRGDDVPF
jgi:DNA helicase-2/ATP-dependent DNA helicase PcrA